MRTFNLRKKKKTSKVKNDCHRIIRPQRNFVDEIHVTGEHINVGTLFRRSSFGDRSETTGAEWSPNVSFFWAEGGSAMWQAKPLYLNTSNVRFSITPLPPAPDSLDLKPSNYVSSAKWMSGCLPTLRYQRRNTESSKRRILLWSRSLLRDGQRLCHGTTSTWIWMMTM